MAQMQAYHRLDEILGEYPETLEVLRTNGFEAKDKDELFRRYGSGTLLNDAVKQLHLNKDMLMNLMKEKVAEKEQAVESTAAIRMRQPAGDLDFVGTTICLLRGAFRDSFDDWMSNWRKSGGGGQLLNCYVPESCGKGNLYADVWQAEQIGDFPGVVTACGFGDFFRAQFVEGLVNKGYFKALTPEHLHPAFSTAGLVDPQGWYTMYGVYPYVLLVDKLKLGDRPMPKRWSDLLDPVYEQQIISVGSPQKIAELLLMNIYKDHGDEGLQLLARNVKTGWHGSRMARTAGSRQQEGAAIYYIPWGFASSCPRSEHVEIVWPEDGAIVNPLFMLAQASRLEKVKPITDFITGVELGRKAAAAYCPVLNPLVDNGLPEAASFKWLGWDYIRNYDIYHLKEHTQSVFSKAWHQ